MFCGASCWHAAGVRLGTACEQAVAPPPPLHYPEDQAETCRSADVSQHPSSWWEQSCTLLWETPCQVGSSQLPSPVGTQYLPMVELGQAVTSQNNWEATSA